MQAIVKDFVERITPDPPSTFWRFPQNPEALAAELEVARAGLGSHNHHNSNQQQQQQQQQPPSDATKFTGPHVFIQLQGALRHGGNPSLAAFESYKGSETCLKIAAAGVREKQAQQELLRREKLAQQQLQQKHGGGKSHRHALPAAAAASSSASSSPSTLHTLESLAAGANATGDSKTDASSSSPAKNSNNTGGGGACCSCHVNDAALCVACHESLRVTVWRLYALTTVIFEFREVCAFLSSSTSSSNSNNKISLPSSFAVAECCAAARDLAGRVFLLARKLHSRWAHQKIKNKTTKQQQRQMRRDKKNKNKNKNAAASGDASLTGTQAPPPAAMLESGTSSRKSSNDRHVDPTATAAATTAKEDEVQVVKKKIWVTKQQASSSSGESADEFEEEEEESDDEEDPDSCYDSSFRVQKFYAATFVEHAIQVALDVLAMLATGFETESVARAAQPHMDRLTPPQEQQQQNSSSNPNTPPLTPRGGDLSGATATTTKQELREQQVQALKSRRKQLFSSMAKLRDVAVVSLAQSLLLTREALMAAFIFSRSCHEAVVAYEEFLTRTLIRNGELSSEEDEDDNNNNSNDPRGGGLSGLSSLRRGNNNNSNDHHGGFSSNRALLIAERHERNLINTELSAVKLARAVLTPPTVFDTPHVDERGEHPSSFVAGELCDEALETAHVFTGVQRQQIAAAIVQRVAALLDPNSTALVASAVASARRRANRRRDHDTDSTTTTLHSRPFAPTRLATQYAVNAALLLLNLSVHDLWVSFARLPSQVRKQQKAVHRSALAAASSPARNNSNTLNQANLDAIATPQQNEISNNNHSKQTAATSTAAHSSPGGGGGGGRPRAASSPVTMTAPRHHHHIASNATPLHMQHGAIEMRPARGGRVQTFLQHVPAAELQQMSTWFAELLTLPTASTDEQHHQQSSLTGSERKSVLAALLGVQWCLYGNPDDRAQQELELLAAQQKLFAAAVGAASSSSSPRSPQTPTQQQQHQQQQPHFLSPASPALAKKLALATPSGAWVTGLFNVSTVALAAGLGHFHNLGISCHSASLARSAEQSLETNLVLSQHRGVLHVPVGSDIFVDSGFMPVVKGQASTLALEAPPMHAVDRKDYAPGLCPEDQRSTVSAVLGAALLVAPKEDLQQQQQKGQEQQKQQQQQMQQQTRLPDPASVSGMASLLTTTLIAVAAPKRQVARIPFSSVRVGSLHKNTANAQLHFGSGGSGGAPSLSSQVEAIVAAEQQSAAQEEADNSLFDAEASAPAFDPHSASSGSNREQLVDLNRTLVLLNNARQLSNVQLGVRAEIQGVTSSSSSSSSSSFLLGDLVEQRPFLGAGFIFSAASEGVKRTALKPEWFKMSQFAAEHHAHTRALLLAPPSQEEKQLILAQQLQHEKQKSAAGGGEANAGNLPGLGAGVAPPKEAPLTLAEKRRQRWAQEAAIHARRAQAAAAASARRNRNKDGDDDNDGTPNKEKTEAERLSEEHDRALAAIQEADDANAAAAEIIKNGGAPAFVSPEKALHEAEAVAARKCAQLEAEVEQLSKDKDDALALVASLRNQADVVATCVIPPLQSEIKLMRHLLGQTLGALRAAERVAERQNEKMLEFEQRLGHMVPSTSAAVPSSAAASSARRGSAVAL